MKDDLDFVAEVQVNFPCPCCETKLRAVSGERFGKRVLKVFHLKEVDTGEPPK